jgi:hypothetical protein
MARLELENVKLREWLRASEQTFGEVTGFRSVVLARPAALGRSFSSAGRRQHEQSQPPSRTTDHRARSLR